MGTRSGQIADSIAAGQATSAGIKLNNAHLVGFIAPSGWTTADVTFQQSADNATWNTIYDMSGNALKLTGVAASRFIAIPGALFGPGIDYIRAVSSVNQVSTVAPIYQVADYR